MHFRIFFVVAGLLVFSACSTTKNTVDVSSADSDGTRSVKPEVAAPAPQSAQVDEASGEKPAFQEVRYDR